MSEEENGVVEIKSHMKRAREEKKLNLICGVVVVPLNFYALRIFPGM